jgi:hypothetical protein
MAGAAVFVKDVEDINSLIEVVEKEESFERKVSNWDAPHPAVAGCVQCRIFSQ